MVLLGEGGRVQIAVLCSTLGLGIGRCGLAYRASGRPAGLAGAGRAGDAGWVAQLWLLPDLLVRLAGDGGGAPARRWSAQALSTRQREEGPRVGWLGCGGRGCRAVSMRAVVGMHTRSEPVPALVDRQRERVALDGLVQDLRSG